jgi:hypothetical protein
MSMTGDNIVVLFRTFEDLQRDEQKIMKDYFAEWEAAYKRFDVAQAAISGDNTALAKFDNTEVALAKAEVESSIKKYGNTGVAEVSSVARLASDLKASVTKRDDRLYGMSALAKRSRRFAMASGRRYYGPAAAVTTIGAKQ